MYFIGNKHHDNIDYRNNLFKHKLQYRKQIATNSLFNHLLLFI